jgi:hypothetical protein
MARRVQRKPNLKWLIWNETLLVKFLPWRIEWLHRRDSVGLFLFVQACYTTGEFC